MKTKNTSGPWTWTDAEALKGPDNALIMGILRTPFERMANRQLIAAAPELLEACKAALRLDYMQEHNALANQLREAVAKAEGTK